jgi:hypothetical protein
MPRFHQSVRAIQVVVLSLWAGLTACIPYTVGSTARPLPRGERSNTSSISVLPSIGDTTVGSRSGSTALRTENETRWGIDDRSDAGLRAVGGGLVFNYKRLLSGPSSIYDVAVMPGMGFVNWGNHIYFESTLMASKRPTRPVDKERQLSGNVVPYFGLRVMHVEPLSAYAVHDRPTAGGFLGVRFGTETFGISPEVGVFYDHSALGVRRNDVVVVPAVSVHGSEMIRKLRDIMRGAGPSFF